MYWSWLYRSNRLRAYRELRKRYGNDSIVAGYIKGAEPKGELRKAVHQLRPTLLTQRWLPMLLKYNIDTIYNLATLLSVVAEKKPQLAWKIGIDGLWNILE